jgi:aerobic carbon-monoxide dehydrogenase large subunit
MMDTKHAKPYVGQPLRRREDRRLLSGKGRYVDDIQVRGMLHVAILRSPHAHAIIASVDLSAARASAGVRLALAGADLLGKVGSIKPNWVLPGTSVPASSAWPIARMRQQLGCG